MNYESALAAIKNLENGADLASAIEAEINRLEAKVYETIGESRKASAKNRALTETLEAVGKLLGHEGGPEVIASHLDERIRALITELSTLKTEKTSLEARAVEAEGRAKNLERQGKLIQVATKTGADVKVLERLLGDKLELEEVAIGDGGVTVGGKAWKEYVETTDDLRPFASVLVPTKNTVNLPSGSPKGESEPADPVAAYSSRNYSGINAFAKKF